jgi:hypothetical protein
MSHFTKIKTKLHNPLMIEKSLGDLNIKWKSGSEKIRGYNKQEHSVDVVIRQMNNHDMGLKWNGNEYALVVDLMFWEQSYSVDKFLNQLNQRYSLHVITKVSEDYSLEWVKTLVLEEGSTRIFFKKFS